jgi:glucose-1-phosphate adenylyltransferase
VLKVDADNRVTDIADLRPEEGGAIINTNIMVMSRADLQTIVSDAIARGWKSFHQDVIAKNLSKKLIRAYQFDGWYSQISSLDSYFDSSMKLLEEDVRRDLFGQDERQIYTKIRNSAPTKYASGASVKNSILADGCVIEGTVENCIIFRNVHIGKGSVVKNCILLQDTYVGANVNLNCVITDKDVVIKDDRNLSGHQTRPFFIGKGETV